MIHVGALVPSLAGEPGRPEDQPIGRAALRLRAEGIEVIFGDRVDDGRLVGTVARPGRYEPAAARIAVAYDRSHSQRDPDTWRALLADLGVPVANPPALTELCRDKIATQRVLEAHGVAIPPIETDPDRFADRLAAWGSAYLKPRYGAFGRGVRRVVPGDPTPARGEGTLAGVDEPLFLQRAIAPPDGWRGVACRVLVQRDAESWWVGPPVARRSATDWVVNAARGSEVVPLADDVDAVRDLGRRTAVALAAEPGAGDLVELGIDVVVGRDELAVVEVNSKPRGRLEALSQLDRDAWMEAHVEACCRPIRWLATRYSAP